MHELLDKNLADRGWFAFGHQLEDVAKRLADYLEQTLNGDRPTEWFETERIGSPRWRSRRAVADA
jgi:hypothetical protein